MKFKSMQFDVLASVLTLAVVIVLLVTSNTGSANQSAQQASTAQVSANGITIKVFEPGCAFQVTDGQITVDSPSLAKAAATVGPNGQVSLTLNGITIDAQNSLQLRQGNKLLIAVSATAGTAPAATGAATVPQGPIRIIDTPKPTIPIPATREEKPKNKVKSAAPKKKPSKPMVK